MQVLLASVVQHLVRLLDFVLVNGGQRLVRQDLLRLAVLLELENELVDVLRAHTDTSLLLLCLQLELVQLFLQVCDVNVLILDLVLLHNQQALHALMLFLESNYMITATLVLFEHFTEVFIGFLGILLDLSLDQR